jgi:Tol biopolymer transport system component
MRRLTLLTLGLSWWLFSGAPLRPAEAGDWLDVVAAKAGENPDIVLVNPEKEPEVLAKHAAADIFPAWSPDRQKIAFASNRDGAFNIYVMNPAGGELEKITSERQGSPVACMCPTWSPEGDKIAYMAREGQKSTLISIDLESRKSRVVSEDAWDPAWSPAGDKIAFTTLRTGKGWQLFTVEPDGAKPTQLGEIENTDGFVYPAWSPDGKRVAFTALSNGQYEILLCDADGGNMKALTKSGRRNTHCAWSPDGKAVNFLHHNEDDTWQWFSATVEDGKTEPIKELKPAPYLHGGRIAWK